jgi:hypothetical protein
MWELTTGCKPFANVGHNTELIYKIIDGKRPEITNDTPECFANLMKKCWDPDPNKRPLISEIGRTFDDWNLGTQYVEQFKGAEEKRMELMKSKKLGPEFSKKPNPKAIFTSRPLSSLISKSSYSSSMIISNTSQGMYHIFLYSSNSKDI